MIKQAIIKPHYPIDAYEGSYEDLPNTTLTVMRTEEHIKRGPFIGQRVWTVVEPEFLPNGTKILGMWIPECDLRFIGDTITNH